jgi:hypothetical protein
MRIHFKPRLARGNALMLTLIALTVLMLLVGGAIQFTNRNREAASEKIRGERIGNCVQAARRHLISRLSLYNVPTDSLKHMDTRLIDEAEPALRTRMITDHYQVIAGIDDAPSVTGAAPLTLKKVSSSTVGGSAALVSGLANRMVDPNTGTAGYYRVVMKCEEPSGNPELRGRQYEVEFLFRHEHVPNNPQG